MVLSILYNIILLWLKNLYFIIVILHKNLIQYCFYILLQAMPKNSGSPSTGWNSSHEYQTHGMHDDSEDSSDDVDIKRPKLS